jgi:hypothetical protein
MGRVEYHIWAGWNGSGSLIRIFHHFLFLLTHGHNWIFGIIYPRNFGFVVCMRRDRDRCTEGSHLGVFRPLSRSIPRLVPLLPVLGLGDDTCPSGP